MKIKSGLKTILLSTLSLMYLSGAVTWILSYWFQVDSGMGPEPTPFRVWWLDVHSVIGLFFMVLFGYLLHSHVRPSWRLRRRRKSGAVLTAGICLLLVTVPGLFYLSNEWAKTQVALFHTYFGLFMFFPFAVHYFFRKR
jgi:hypothetical protein